MGRMAVLVCLVAVIVMGPAARAALAGDGDGAPASPTAEAMTALDAVVLGLVEGITEFLPISSTGHLTVTQDLLGIGTGRAEEKEAADAYAVVIQAGAILAVVVLYWRRLMSLLNGLLGRDPDGRRVLIALVIAFVPAAVSASSLESKIKDQLFGVGPVDRRLGGRRCRCCWCCRSGAGGGDAEPGRRGRAGAARSPRARRHRRRACRSTRSPCARPPSSAPAQCWPCGRAPAAAS